jgi:hypothetical protein
VLKATQEIGPFVIRHPRECIVRVLVLEGDCQFGVFVADPEFVYILVELCEVTFVHELFKGWAHEFSDGQLLYIAGETLIEPETAPILAADQIASPRMCHLVDEDLLVSPASVHADRGNEGYYWVFHAPERKYLGQNHEIVLSPFVFEKEILKGAEIILAALELSHIFLELTGLGDHPDPSRNPFAGKLPTHNRKQIRANRYILLKMSLLQGPLRLMREDGREVRRQVVVDCD